MIEKNQQIKQNPVAVKQIASRQAVAELKLMAERQEHGQINRQMNKIPKLVSQFP